MGAAFGRCIARASLAELAAFAHRTRCLVVAATPNATRDYREVSYRRPLVIMLGSERRGLRADEERACDVRVRIPMVGRTDSLNLAVAASIMLYEVYGQRHPVCVAPSR
jgi:TrmH family RNA methyltransferase